MRATQSLELTDDERRVAAAMRELRRGVGMQSLRGRIYGSGPDVLDLGQHDALIVIVDCGGARMSELAAALRVDASTATRAVARLEADGLVARQRDPADGRSVVVVPTDAGRDRLDRLAEVGRDAMRQLLATFEPDELHQLGGLLERLVAAVDDLVADPVQAGPGQA